MTYLILVLEDTVVVRYDGFRIEKYNRTPQGYLDVAGVVTRTGVFVYHDGNELRSESEVLNPKSLSTLKALPVTHNHPPDLLDPGSTSAYMKGYLGSEGYPEKNGELTLLKVDHIIITDPVLIDAIETEKIGHISMGYNCDVEPASGVFDGLEYTKKQVNIVYNHLACVAHARGGEVCAIYKGDEAMVYRIDNEEKKDDDKKDMKKKDSHRKKDDEEKCDDDDDKKDVKKKDSKKKDKKDKDLVEWAKEEEKEEAHKDKKDDDDDDDDDEEEHKDTAESRPENEEEEEEEIEEKAEKKDKKKKDAKRSRKDSDVMAEILETLAKLNAKIDSFGTRMDSLTSIEKEPVSEVDRVLSKFSIPSQRNDSSFTEYSSENYLDKLLKKGKV